MLETKQRTTSLGTFKISWRQPATSAPLIVFLSGMGQFDTAETFIQVISALPTNLGIFAIDYLNSGYSSVPAKDYTVTEEATTIATLINEFNEEKSPIILVAHSIGGIYALLMAPQIKHLIGFVGIEPTTREVVVNPPQEPEYLKAATQDATWTPADFEKWLKNHSQKEFSAAQHQQIWQTYQKSVARLTEADSQRMQGLMASMPWTATDLTLPQDLASILLTEEYRAAEMKRSEYQTANAKSQVLTGGTYHYLHWEQPQLVVAAIQQLI